METKQSKTPFADFFAKVRADRPAAEREFERRARGHCAQLLREFAETFNGYGRWTSGPSELRFRLTDPEDGTIELAFVFGNGAWSDVDEGVYEKDGGEPVVDSQAVSEAAAELRDRLTQYAWWCRDGRWYALDGETVTEAAQ
jgi:hypothetical protein